MTVLTDSIKELNEEKRRQFELLQSRQEEIETSNSAREAFDAKLKEAVLQTKDAQERASLAEDALAEIKRNAVVDARSPPPSKDSATVDHQATHNAVAEANAQAQQKHAELRDEIARLERERVELDEEHARQLRSQRTEIERVKHTASDKDREIQEMIRSRKGAEDRLTALEQEKEALNRTVDQTRAALRSLQEEQDRATNGEVGAFTWIHATP